VIGNGKFNTCKTWNLGWRRYRRTKKNKNNFVHGDLYNLDKSVVWVQRGLTMEGNLSPFDPVSAFNMGAITKLNYGAVKLGFVSRLLDLLY